MTRGFLCDWKFANISQNKVYAGKHSGIIPQDLWNKVQELIRCRINDPHAFGHYQTHQTVLAGKLYDDKEQAFRLTSSNKKGKKFLYYYNGVGGHYLPVEQLDSFVLKTLKMTDFGDLEPLANRDCMSDIQMQKWIIKVVCQSVDKTHYLSIFLNEKLVRSDLNACPRVSGQAETLPLSVEKLDDTVCVRNTFIVDNVSSVKLQNGTARNILTVRQLNESLVRGLSRGWQLKRLLEKGKTMRECEAEIGMNKRTFARYLNLCYLSPKIVSDILEYKNPRNISLKELMNLAEGESAFTEQEKRWCMP